MDDAYLGGERPGKRGRGAGHKFPFVAAVQTDEEGHPQRVQLRRVSAFTLAEIRRYAEQAIAPGSQAPLDTLVLAMPVSWKGTLQQYAGRLHREHSDKENVRILDYVDAGHPALLRMWSKRRRGYRAMGYRVDEETQYSDLFS